MYLSDKEAVRSKDMELEAFAVQVQNEIAKRLPGIQLTVKHTVKNNGVVMTGLHFFSEEESRVSPIIYLNELFEKYRSEMDMEQIVRKILSMYSESMAQMCSPADCCLDFEKVKEQLLYKLVNFDRNRDYLKTVPFIPFHDLAVVFYLFMGEKDGMAASLMIGNELMHYWGINSPEELAKIAHANTKKQCPALVKNIGSLIGESLFGADADEKDAEDCLLYVATNRLKSYGAAVILYDGLLKDFAEKIGGDFYILPSSVHETIFVPADMVEFHTAELRRMVEQVNREEVEDIEVLSDSVYRYYADRGCMEIVE